MTQTTTRALSADVQTHGNAGDIIPSMVRKMNHHFKNFLTMNSSINNAVMMRHRECDGHKMLFSAHF